MASRLGVVWSSYLQLHSTECRSPWDISHSAQHVMISVPVCVKTRALRPQYSHFLLVDVSATGDFGADALEASRSCGRDLATPVSVFPALDAAVGSDTLCSVSPGGPEDLTSLGSCGVHGDTDPPGSSSSSGSAALSSSTDDMPWCGVSSDLSLATVSSCLLEPICQASSICPFSCYLSSQRLFHDL